MPIKSSEKSRLAELREEMGHVNASPTARRAVPGRKVKTMHHSPKKKAHAAVSCHPSLLRRLCPTNLEEAEKLFFASKCSLAPFLNYPGSPTATAGDAERHSKVHVDYLRMAEKILCLVKQRYATSEAYMAATYGTATIPAEKFKERVAEYVAELGMWQRVEVRYASTALSVARVSRSAPRSPFVISIQKAPVLTGMARPICDHEAGTHLIRMANDCGQAWFNRKSSWGLRNHHETEEGLATINSLLSLNHSLLLWSPALRYYAACRASNLGFVELFHELEQFVEDPVRRFRLCVRVKRGLRDLSLPGAVNIDQSYFCGCVDILRHFRDIDLTLLYAGQVAIQDIDKVRRLVRPEMCLLPPFLSCGASLASYRCLLGAIAAENEIAPATVPLYRMLPSAAAKGSVMLARQATMRTKTSKAVLSKGMKTTGFSARSTEPRV